MQITLCYNFKKQNIVLLLLRTSISATVTLYILKTIGKCSARGISDILGEEEKYCIEREDPADQRIVDIPTTFFDSGMQ